MSELTDFKADCLNKLRSRLVNKVDEITRLNATHQDKAKMVNSAIAAAMADIHGEVRLLKSSTERQQKAITLHYCGSVLYLEYRHSVWPYEYMALSRRVGELWQNFCSSAWDHPTRKGVERFDAPNFSEVIEQLHKSSEPVFAKY